jgi:hypothetical protein
MIMGLGRWSMAEQSQRAAAGWHRWGVYEQTGKSDPADQGRRLAVEWTADL